MTFSNRDQIKRYVKQAEGHLAEFRILMIFIHEIYDNASSLYGTDYSKQDATVAQLHDFCGLLSETLEAYRREMV